MSIPKMKSGLVTARNNADAQKYFWQNGGDFKNVQMARLETEQRRVIQRHLGKR